MEKKDIVSYNYDELQDEIKSIGEKPFRAKQIYAWLHEKLAEEFDEMTNLSKALREKLDQAYEIRKVKVVAHQISKVDPTEKLLSIRMAEWVVTVVAHFLVRIAPRLIALLRMLLGGWLKTLWLQG